MIKNNKILAVIPARGGSKGVVGKNICMLAGKPLIAWTIEAARESAFIDRLILSSNDSEIIDIARKWGCDVPFVRPDELAKDETPGIEPVLHALTELPGYDIVLLLQPTSPLRQTGDIDSGLVYFMENRARVCVSISPVRQNPFWMYTLDNNQHLLPVMNTEKNIVSRQELPKIYIPNGALFIGQASYLAQKKTFYTDDTVGFIMDSKRSLDIDEKQDFLLAELALQNDSAR